MLIHQIEIVSRPSEDVQSMMVMLNKVEYLVTMNNKSIDNISYYKQPLDSKGKSGKELIESTSIDADTYFTIAEFVNTFTKLNKK